MFFLYIMGALNRLSSSFCHSRESGNPGEIPHQVRDDKSIHLVLLIILLGIFSISFSAEAFQEVYLTPKKALSLAFHNSEKVVSEKKTLTPEQKKMIEKKSGVRVSKDTWTFYLGKTGKVIEGYAIIDHQVGKTEPITFMTTLTPGGVVKNVEVLVYRETHGAEIKAERFRRQFQGKTVQDPLRVGRDIKNMSGATLSSRAIAVGVKRGVLLWETFYGKK
jgi:Na+-translocating ferredoxin:NAD+ oxidoreductase subunit G